MPTGTRWVSANEASEIISANSGHVVSADYVRLLAKKGKLQFKPKNGRENEYLLSDVRACRVEGKGENRTSGPTERQKRAMKKVSNVS